MKLRDALPKEFFFRHMTRISRPLHVLKPTRAAQLLEVEVKVEHNQSSGLGKFVKWPGRYVNVHVWWELENGYRSPLLPLAFAV